MRSAFHIPPRDKKRNHEQTLLFPIAPETDYTERLQKLIRALRGEIRTEFIRVKDLPTPMSTMDLEDLLIDSGLFKEGEIDFLWTHSVYDSPTGTLQDREQFVHKMKGDIVEMLTQLMGLGYHGRYQVRRRFRDILAMRRRRDAATEHSFQ